MIKQLTVAVLGCSIITGCVAPKDTLETRPRTAEETCVYKGVNYFKAIGSYPYLSDGRNAVTVAKERCSRTTGAFG